MRFKWTGNGYGPEGLQLGDLDVSRMLSVQEMRRVKQELGSGFKHPAKLVAGALDFDTLTEVLDADGKVKMRPVLDERDRPKLDAAGEPLLEPVKRREPSEDWDPDAFAMLVVLLAARVGKDWYIEDIDGFIPDLIPESSAGEIEQLKKAAEEAGKASAAESTSPATTSTDGSTSAPPDSGTSSA